MRKRRQGTEIKSETRAGVAVGIGSHKHLGAATVTGAAGVSLEVERDLKADEDLSIYTTIQKNLKVFGALILRFGSLFHGWTRSHVGRFEVNAEVGGGPKDYRESKNIEAHLVGECSRSSSGCVSAMVPRSGDDRKLRERTLLAAKSGVAIVQAVLCPPLITPPRIRKPFNPAQKMEKGTHNTKKLDSYAANLDVLNGILCPTLDTSNHGSLAAATSQYPQLDIDSLIVPGDERRLPEASFNIHRSVMGKQNMPVGSGYGLAVRGAISGQYDGIDWVESSAGLYHQQAAASISGEHVRSRVALLRQYAPHYMLDPAYNKSPDGAKRSLAKYAQLNTNLPTRRFFDAITDQLSLYIEEDVENPSLTTKNITQKIANISAAVAQIKERYANLLEVAQLLRNVQDPAYLRDLRQTETHLIDVKIKEFVAAVFGSTLEANSKKALAFWKRLTKNPTEFMRDAYDALSMALGKVAVEIYDNRAKIREISKKELAGNFLYERSKPCEIAHRDLALQMTEIGMPISPESLLYRSSMFSKAFSINSTTNLIAELGANATTSFFQIISSNQISPTTTSTLPRFRKVRCLPNNLVSGANVAITWATKTVDSHANPERAGTYVNWKLKGGCDGIGAAVLEFFSTDVTKTKGNNVDPQRENASFIDKVKRGTTTPTMRALGSEHRCALETIFATHKPLDTVLANGTVKHTTRYEDSVIYSRLTEVQTQKIGGTLVIPVFPGPIPLVIYLTASSTTTAITVEREIMGNDLGYHTFSLDELNEAFAEAAVADSDVRPSRTISVLGQVYDARKLESCLFAEKNRFLLEKYFSLDDSILGMVEKFDKYDKKYRRELDSVAPNFADLDRRERTAFERYDIEPNYWETIKIAPGATHDASCGTMGQGGLPGLSGEKFREGPVSDMRPASLSIAEKGAMDYVRAEFNKISPMSAVERMQFLLGINSGSGSSKADSSLVLSAYFRIIQAYHNINQDTKPAHSYTLDVREPI